MENVIQFKRDTRAEEGAANVTKAFEELRVLVESGEIEGLMIVGTVKDGTYITCIAGLLSHLQVLGILEATKFHVLTS